MTEKSLRLWARGAPAGSVESQQRQELVKQLLGQAQRTGVGDAATLVVRHSLTLAYDAITSLPEGLHVEGTLSVTPCASLEALPRGLWARGLLGEDCAKLVTIHPSVRVDRKLTLRGCTQLTAIPEAVIINSLERSSEWDLRETGISEELASKLRRLKYVEVDDPHEDWEDRPLATWQAASAFWQMACPLLIERSTQAPQQSAALLRLSEAVRRTEHGAHPRVLPTLAARMLRLFAACDDASLAAAVAGASEPALEQGDHPVLSLLPRLEEQAAIHRALGSATPEASLRAVRRAGLAQSLLARVVSEHATTLFGCDSLELSLAYAAALADRIQGIEAPCYPRGQLAAVTDRDAVSAERRVRSGVEAEEATDLAAWPPLQRFLRQQAAESLDDQALNVLSTALFAVAADAVCPITQVSIAELERPIAVEREGVATVYDRATLLAWWVDRGTDPMRQPMDLTMLRRLPTPRVP